MPLGSETATAAMLSLFPIFRGARPSGCLIRPAARLGDGSSMLFTVLHSGKLSASRRFDASPSHRNSTAVRAFQRADGEPAIGQRPSEDWSGDGSGGPAAPFQTRFYPEVGPKREACASEQE